MKLYGGVLVCAIERGDEAHIPNGDFVFEERDVVSIVATVKNANEFFKKIQHKGNSIKNVMVIGGGAITHYLCGILESSGLAMKIVEKDLKTCEELASRWQKASVIHGSLHDRELLIEEGLADAGAVVALSSSDEENILLSLFAKETGSGKLITKIKRTDYGNVISKLDLDTTICPKNITSDMILRYVRATQNTQGSNIETLYNIIEGQVEAMEFIVKENSPIIGVPLWQLPFKNNVLIASISRGKQVIVPKGSDVIQAGDAVVVVSKQMALRDVADVLQ